MISTKDLFGLPNAERLKNFCKGLAALDIIMVEEEWSFIRHYTYNPAWRKGKEAFFATDGSDQSMIVMFAPEGCVINGVDSELYDWEEKFPRIEDLTDGMPSALQKLMGSREVKKMKSTFCVWTEDGTTWHCNPMDGEDASKDLRECPRCHSTLIDRLQRITGYLVGTTDRWNNAKLAELNDRVVHQ